MTGQLPFRFGSEVYTWFMHNDGQTHAGRLTHMIEIISQAGFTGIQPIHFWMGDLSDPDRLEAKLKEQGIKLAAIALALEWNGTEENRKGKSRSRPNHSLIAAISGGYSLHRTKTNRTS